MCFRSVVFDRLRLVFYSLSRTQSKQPELLTYSTLNCYTASREDLADLRSAAVVPDVLSRLDQAAGVTLNISYGADVNFHTSAGHLTLAQTANAPTVRVRSCYFEYKL